MDAQNSAFFQNLQEIVTDPIFIGRSANDLQEEIRTNMWRISISEEEQKNLSVGKLKEFLTQVIENRWQQIAQAQANHGMIFYLWHDAQASQLRFNLISDYHTTLPFSCKVNPVPVPDSILEGFLSQLLLIPVVEEAGEEETESGEYALDVYVTTLPQY